MRLSVPDDANLFSLNHYDQDSSLRNSVGSDDRSMISKSANAKTDEIQL